MEWKSYGYTWESGLLMAFAARLVAQLPGGLSPDQYIKLVDTTSSWTGYKWACALVLGFTSLFLVGIWYGIRAAKSVVKENRELNVRYTSALEKYAGLLATYTEKAQDLTRNYDSTTKETQEIARNTNRLIEQDIKATEASSRKSEEQTKTLDQLKDIIQRNDRNTRP
jgi:hypothetical protein